jgi:hypothetical protein
MAGGTFSAALAIGFVMQNSDALASRFAGDDAANTTVALAIETPQTASTLVSAPVQSTPATENVAVVERTVNPEIVPPRSSTSALVALVPAVSALASKSPTVSALTAALPAIGDHPMSVGAPIQMAALEFDEPIMTETPLAVPLDIAPVESCQMELTAYETKAAMVQLTLNAPCQINARATIHHQGMMFTAITDDLGGFDLAVPALTQEAVFIIAFDDGEGAVASTSVPSLDGYDRAVLQWQGDMGFSLHALENGADYGATGHVWHGAAQDTGIAEDGNGGFLVRFGDVETLNPLIAEIYTYPKNAGPRDGSVLISVETEITQANCGRDLAAQSLQIVGDMEIQALDLEMMMPECDAVGDFLVLNNMLKDLTLASN